MKKHTILAAAAASTLAAVGLTACGQANTPAAQPQPFPRERQCQDIPKPADPHNVIGTHWFKDDACDILNLNHPGPGVDADQAEKIVYDARMRMLFGKRDIAMLAIEANKQLDHPTGVVTDFADIIAARYSTIKDEVSASRDALGGHAPEGYRIFILKGEGR